MNWRSRPSAPDDCETILPLLSLQADGMTSADESRRVEAHLGDCGGCRRAQRWMQATHLAIAQRAPVAPPADLRARIAQAVAAQAAPVVFTTRRRPLVLRPAFAAAAALAVAAAWVGHSALTARPTALTVQPPQVAVVPTVTPPPVPPAPPTAGPPHSARVAIKPAVKAAPVRVSPASPERVARATDAAPPRGRVTEPTAPAAPPRPVARPKTTLLAIKPTEPPTLPVKPRPVTHAARTVHVASVPRATVHDVKPDVTPAPAARLDPAPTVVAVAPRETPEPAPAPAVTVRTAAAPEPAPVRVAHREDSRIYLSGVRAHLISFGSDNGPRKISMDKSARTQAVPFVQGALAYTPTHEDAGRE